MLKSELIEQNKNLLKQNGELMYLLEFGKLKTLDSKCQMVWERDSNAWQLKQENQQLKDRIDKAIEMIGKMTEKELNDIAYKGEHYLVCGSDFGEGADIILDILKGDKE